MTDKAEVEMLINVVFTILGIRVEIHSSFGGFSCKIIHFQCPCNNMAAAIQLATISYGEQKKKVCCQG